MYINAEIIELGDGRFMIELDSRPDDLGPLTYAELRAIMFLLNEEIGGPE